MAMLARGPLPSLPLGGKVLLSALSQLQLRLRLRWRLVLVLIWTHLLLSEFLCVHQRGGATDSFCFFFFLLLLLLLVVVVHEPSLTVDDTPVKAVVAVFVLVGRGLWQSFSANLSLKMDASARTHARQSKRNQAIKVRGSTTINTSTESTSANEPVTSHNHHRQTNLARCSLHLVQ